MKKSYFTSTILMSLALILSACTSSGPSASSRSSYPSQATYICGSSSPIIVQYLRSTVVVTTAGSDPVTLPASPPGQPNRYSEGLYTLVLDGRTAFWHKTGDLPRDCRR